MKRQIALTTFVIFYLVFISAYLSPNQSFAKDIKANPKTRITLKGVLLFDGNDYSLKLDQNVRCIGESGAEEIGKIFIGAGHDAPSKYPFLKAHVNSPVSLNGIVDDSRGGCVFHSVKLQ